MTPKPDLNRTMTFVRCWSAHSSDAIRFRRHGHNGCVILLIYERTEECINNVQQVSCRCSSYEDA